MRRLPLLVAWSTIVLAVLDGLSRLDSRIGRTIDGLFSWGVGLPGIAGAKVPPALRTELLAISWIAAFVAGVALAGFYGVPSVFLAGDYAATKRRLKRRKVRHSEQELPQIGRRQIFLEGPEGVWIELIFSLEDAQRKAA